VTDAIRSTKVVELIDAWRSVAIHGGACSTCSPAVQTLCTSSEPRRDAESEAAMCEDGKTLFGRWWDAKQAWLDRTVEHRRRQFLTQAQLWDDGVTFERRALALIGMPDRDFKGWLRLPDDRRHQQLRSLEAALHHPPTLARICAFPPCDQPVTDDRYEYCSVAHQGAHRRAQRRKLALVPTEE
jgi:hypothetical protein